MCVSGDCEVTGAVAASEIRRAFLARAPAFLACDRRRADPERAYVIVLDFEIDRDGTVLRPFARGPDEVASCVLGVLQTLELGQQTAQTTVHHSLRFATARAEKTARRKP